MNALAQLDRLGPEPWSLDRMSGLHPLLVKYGAAEAHTTEGKRRLPGRAELLEAPEYSVADLLWGARNPAFVARNM
jgi:hypothetical protein